MSLLYCFNSEEKLSEKRFSKSQTNVSKGGESKLGQEFLHGRRDRIQDSLVPDQKPFEFFLKPFQDVLDVLILHDPRVGSPSAVVGLPSIKAISPSSQKSVFVFLFLNFRSVLNVL